jgi:hypothetical protein
MFGLFRKRSAAPSSKQSADPGFGERDQNPVVTASIMGAAETGPWGKASALEGEQAKPDYETFCATFCFRPGKNFIDFLKTEGVTRMLEWLQWTTPEAEPKAFIRLMLELQKQGKNIWDQPGISMFVDGRWSQGGGPSRFSQDALSVLAQILERPIKVYFNKTPNDPLKVLEFQP